MARTVCASSARHRRAAISQWFRSGWWGRPASSDLPRLEINPRIDPHIGQVGDEVDDEADERKDEERAEHDGVVAVENALEAEQPQPVQREDGLDQKRAREEGVNEGAGKARD